MIALENARPYLSQSPYTYAECIGPLKEQILRVNRDNVNINLDFGHLFMASRFYAFDPLTAVRQIKDHVVHTHVHDNFGGSVHHWEKQQTHQLPFGRGDSHMPVGYGQIPIQAILDILLPDYDGLLVMATPEPPWTTCPPWWRPLHTGGGDSLDGKKQVFCLHGVIQPDGAAGCGEQNTSRDPRCLIRHQ